MSMVALVTHSMDLNVFYRVSKVLFRHLHSTVTFTSRMAHSLTLDGGVVHWLHLTVARAVKVSVTVRLAVHITFGLKSVHAVNVTTTVSLTAGFSFSETVNVTKRLGVAPSVCK